MCSNTTSWPIFVTTRSNIVWNKKQTQSLIQPAVSHYFLELFYGLNELDQQESDVEIDAPCHNTMDGRCGVTVVHYWAWVVTLFYIKICMTTTLPQLSGSSIDNSIRVLLSVYNLGAKTINVFRACLGAQLTICAQKWRNFVLFSMVSFRFVFSRVCVFLYSLGPSAMHNLWCGYSLFHGIGIYTGPCFQLFYSNKIANMFLGPVLVYW